MPEQSEKQPVPRMLTKDIKEFVLGVCDGKIWTDRHCPSARDVQHSFMILSLCELKDVDLDSIGCIWEWISKANPMSVNGMPTFFSCRLMHKDDAAVAFKAIEKEYKRRDLLTLELQQELDLKGK